MISRLQQNRTASDITHLAMAAKDPRHAFHPNPVELDNQEGKIRCTDNDTRSHVRKHKGRIFSSLSLFLNAHGNENYLCDNENFLITDR